MQTETHEIGRRLQQASRGLSAPLFTFTAEELVDDADERLFSKVRYCAYHVLEELLPPK